MVVYQTPVRRRTAAGGWKLDYVRYNLFSKDEADKLNLNYHRRPYIAKNIKKGDYVLTDDGFVVPVLNVVPNHVRKCLEMQLPSGKFAINNHVDNVVTALTRAEPYSIKSSKYGSRKLKPFRKVLFAIILVNSNFNLKIAYESAFNEPFGSPRTVEIVNILLQDEGVIRVIMTRMEELYKKAGIDPSTIINRVDRVLNALVNRVESSNSAKDVIELSREAVSVAKVMGDWAGFTTAEPDYPAVSGMMIAMGKRGMLQSHDSDSIFDDDVDEKKLLEMPDGEDATNDDSQ